MTIDVGYAHLALDDGTELDFVDVPGHDRLVGNMLVGAGEIDAALLVIAADDGPRAQTIEHLELLDGLGIVVGLAVVTKTDGVRAERTAAVIGEVRALLARTSLSGAAILPAAAPTGAGLDEVRDALVDVRDRVLGTRAAALAAALEATGEFGGDRAPGVRLAIDRVFSVRGRGTVVTGTLRNGPLERGAHLRIVPDSEGRSVRVREIQVHGRTVERADDGRVALNVAGSEGVAALARGTVLTTDPAVQGSDRMLVAIRAPWRVLQGAPPIRADRGMADGLPADRARVTVHLGTAHVAGTIGRSGRDSVDLGASGVSAIVRLDHPVALRAGDRFVVRRPSPGMTLAGGRVLDADPPRGVARRRSTVERLQALADAAPGTAEWTAARLELHGADDHGSAPDLAPDVAGWLDERLAAAVPAPDGTPGRDADPPGRGGAPAVNRPLGRAGAARRGPDRATRDGRQPRSRRRPDRPARGHSGPAIGRAPGGHGPSRRHPCGRCATPAGRGGPLGLLPGRRRPAAGTNQPDRPLRRPRLGHRHVRRPRSTGACAGDPGAAHAGDLSGRDRDEPEVRDGAPRGVRSPSDSPAHAGRPCPRSARRDGARRRAAASVVNARSAWVERRMGAR